MSVFPVLVEDPTRAAEVSARIDALFENSAYATRTETERAFRLGFVQMLGNIALFLRVIGAAVVFTILLVSANTMIMAARERIPETGVMKTLGFSDRALFTLFMVEAIALALLGGALGSFGARACRGRSRPPSAPSCRTSPCPGRWWRRGSASPL
ncbi:MAG: ABC transporter permease [Planctomycetes bacterium]|nr:ABC transporter permease [Planctomycetota bacterium]